MHLPDTLSSIQASEVKAKCLALMGEVARSGTPILITRNGKPPVAELWPHRRPRAGSLIGPHKGQVAAVGDVVSPLAGVRWDAPG